MILDVLIELSFVKRFYGKKSKLIHIIDRKKLKFCKVPAAQNKQKTPAFEWKTGVEYFRLETLHNLSLEGLLCAFISAGLLTFPNLTAFPFLFW